MKQIFLSGQGQVEIIEVPVPARMRGSILVQSAFSLISSGTEGAAVTKRSGAAGLLEKAIQSRSRAGQVWTMVQRQGVASAIAAIHTKLDGFTQIGYSCAGTIVESDSDATGFRAGQRVACMGAGLANHAQFNVVPKNLAVALPDTVPFSHAAFGALACIAMQGIRRLELSPGERIGIVGLGLIGQLSLRLACAMGYECYGVDIDDERVARAIASKCAKLVFNSRTCDAPDRINGATDGVGLDGVVICASAASDELVNEAFVLCRKRGRVAVVGDIGMGLDRARMYAKELELRLSCSYGIGRYDAQYELDGLDYPLAYVRWTERRNLAYFISLLADRRLDVSDLVSATFDIDDAKQAYARVKGGNGATFGVLLDYQIAGKSGLPEDASTCRYARETVPTSGPLLRLGIVGVGAYAKAIHIPNIKKIPRMRIGAIASKSGASAAIAARSTTAHYATSDLDKIYTDADIDALVISTRHASHATIALAGLDAGKHVFVEKPLATSVLDCLEIVRRQQRTGCVVRVGFNRRFSPYMVQMKRAVGIGRRIFNVRVNVGAVGAHWSSGADEGGRLLGEGVHFVDLANWVIGEAPVFLSAHFVGPTDRMNPDIHISIRYADGSVANISYTTIGNIKLGKEYFELFGNGRTVVVDDYRRIRGHGCAPTVGWRERGNKGQLSAMAEFCDAALDAHADQQGADARAGAWATLLIDAAIESAMSGQGIDLVAFMERISDGKFDDVLACMAD